MAGHTTTFCVSVVIKKAGKLEATYISNKLVRISPKLSWDDALDEVLREKILPESHLVALENATIELSEKSGFNINPMTACLTDTVETALEFEKNIKYIRFSGDLETNEPSQNTVTGSEKEDAFKVLMGTSITKIPKKKDSTSLRFTGTILH